MIIEQEREGGESLPFLLGFNRVEFRKQKEESSISGGWGNP